MQARGWGTTTPAWVVLLAEEESQLQVTRYLNNGAELENVDLIVFKRISKCQQSLYGLRDAGMSYPGADASVNKYLWTSICQPTLLYGMECVHLSQSTMSRLETVQGNHIKQSLGLNKYARTSYLLDSLQLPHVKSAIVKKCATLYHSIFNSDAPTTDPNAHLMARNISSGELIKGTLIHSIVCFGLSPVSIDFAHLQIKKYKYSTQDGIIHTLQHLLYHQNFIKPYSDEHYFVHLLIYQDFSSINIIVSILVCSILYTSITYAIFYVLHVCILCVNILCIIYFMFLRNGGENE